MPGRHESSGDYRYGYQGSEKDNEVKGLGNSYTTHFRQLDPRIGRWLSVDPKAINTPWESPYVSMGNNPILYNDIKGDSIPTRFLNGYKKMGETPAEFKDMMMKEYGFEVGYNSKTEMLYLVKDHGPVEGGSSTVRDMLKEGLTSTLTGRQAKKAFGNLVVGYNIINEHNFGTMPISLGIHEKGIGKKSSYRTSYLNLSSFEMSKESGEYIPKNLTFVNVDHKVFNMARVFEHEYLGHGQLGLKDGGSFKPGKNISFENKIREEMGLPARLNYWDSNGNTQITLVGDKEVDRKTVRKMIENYEQYPHIRIGK